jgi:urate oxidase
MGVVLGTNQYGKSENRVVRVYRDTDRHEIRDLNVSTWLRGDFAEAHITGDQANVLPTDTQKNTAFAYAKEHGVTSPEDYAIALGRHFLDAAPPATGALVQVDEYAWDRIEVDGAGHDHSFVRRGTETRRTWVTVDGRGDEQQVWVVSGFTDLTVFKSTGSEFKGFLKDRYTTLQETDDRILATSLTVSWRHEGTSPQPGTDWEASYQRSRKTLLAAFATTYSRALQETLYAMGQTVLESDPGIAEIKFSAPNKHHFLVDLSPFGLENSGEVFHAADRPYGLIEASVCREGASPAGDAWLAVPGFC